MLTFAGVGERTEMLASHLVQPSITQALARIDELMGCIVDQPEERELAALADAADAFEGRQGGPATVKDDTALGLARPGMMGASLGRVDPSKSKKLAAERHLTWSVVAPRSQVSSG